MFCKLIKLVIIQRVIAPHKAHSRKYQRNLSWLWWKERRNSSLLCRRAASNATEYPNATQRYKFIFLLPNLSIKKPRRLVNYSHFCTCTLQTGVRTCVCTFLLRACAHFWQISLGLTCFQFAFAYVLPSSHHLLGISGSGGLRSPQIHEADSV